MLLMVLREYWGVLEDCGGDLDGPCGPGVLEELEEPEAVFTESPTGIAYGTSVLFLPSFPSGLDGLNLMLCLMGPKSFLEGL